MLTEKEMLDQLRQGRISLPPLTFRLLDDQVKIGDGVGIDAHIEAKWKRKSAKFAVECKALSTPKFFMNSVNFLKSLTLPKNVFPMLFMPFLSERQLNELEREGISGIDLCGNGVVISPGTFSVYRSGARNRFPSSAAIKNIYRKNSSMVGRGFFVSPGFKTVQDIRATVNRQNLLVNRWKKKADEPFNRIKGAENDGRRFDCHADGNHPSFTGRQAAGKITRKLQSACR